MSRTPSEISARIRAQLAITAPGLSLERGTPERKIIDACAEAISEAAVDQYLLGSMFDIDSKVGIELEQFVGIFGYGRLQGRPAQGIVRVTLNTPATQDYEIPLGTQFYTKAGVTGTENGGQPLYFASTEAVVLTAGSQSVDVPVQCTVPGTIGNVPPDTVTYIGTSIGAGSATNLTAMTGGVDTETDAELRQRFKDTLLRNIAGTVDYYKALCLQNERVSRVAVFGPVELCRTQIEVPQNTIPDLLSYLGLSSTIRYVWPEMHSCYSNLGQEDQVFYSPLYDYTLGSGSTPTFTRVSSGDLEPGQVVDLEFQYTPRCSRNDPVNGVTNKIDIFVDGVESARVTEKTIMTSTALSANPADRFYIGNFERVGSEGQPEATNRFMRLGSVPIVSFPSTITVGNVVYSQGVHYHLVRDTTLVGGSHLEISGIEWESSGPSNGTELTVTYIYNRVPEMLAHLMSSAKQIGSDVMVHQAKFRYIRPCLSVQYDRAYAIQTTNNAIGERLRAHFTAMTFGNHVRVSSLCMAVQQVLGVVDVKLTTSAEAPDAYGIQVYNGPTDPTPAAVYTNDFRLDDESVPVFMDVVILRKAAF